MKIALNIKRSDVDLSPEGKQYGACLLHADYHILNRDCWNFTTNWFIKRHQEGGDPVIDRANYQREVEEAMMMAILERGCLS